MIGNIPFFFFRGSFFDLGFIFFFSRSLCCSVGYQALTLLVWPRMLLIRKLRHHDQHLYLDDSV